MPTASIFQIWNFIYQEMRCSPDTPAGRSSQNWNFRNWYMYRLQILKANSRFLKCSIFLTRTDVSFNSFPQTFELKMRFHPAEQKISTQKKETVFPKRESSQDSSKWLITAGSLESEGCYPLLVRRGPRKFFHELCVWDFLVGETKLALYVGLLGLGDCLTWKPSGQDDEDA